MVVIRTEYLHIFIKFYLFIGLWKFGNLKPNTFGWALHCLNQTVCDIILGLEIIIINKSSLYSITKKLLMLIGLKSSRNPSHVFELSETS